MWRKIGGCVLASVCLLSACDKGSDNSPKPPEPGPVVPLPKPDVPAHPTTQALDGAVRSKLDLKYVPLSLMVPSGYWKVRSQDVGSDMPQVLLEGPTLSDDIRFRIALARTLAGDFETKVGNQAKLLEVHANEMLKLHPDLLGTTVVHDIPGGKVIEQLKLNTLEPTPEELALKSPAATQPIETAEWTFTVVVPAGKSFTAYDLTATLPLSQYKADHGFVRSIMDTLKFDPTMTDTVVK